MMEERNFINAFLNCVCLHQLPLSSKLDDYLCNEKSLFVLPNNLNFIIIKIDLVSLSLYFEKKKTGSTNMFTHFGTHPLK